ncbi:MAG: SDR family oxidoreductase [Burkholderiales bacterium]
MPAQAAETPRVVITGASSGIGRALAREYARRGAILGLVGRRRDALEELAASLPVRCLVYAADVRDAMVLSAAARHFMQRAGTPDIVIANAGISAGNDSAEAADNAVFEEILATNVTGMMLSFQPFLETMKRRRGGVLAGMASVAGFRGLPGASAYSASKAAAISYLESLRVELRGSGIRVVTICPGYIATPMTAGNRYPMPFLMPADAAARSIVVAIDRGSRFHVLPWQMALVGWLLRRLPRPLYDRAFARAPRKARRAP